MHKQLEIIKKNESNPKVLKKIFSKEEIEKFAKLYNELPITVHNKKQNVIKKRWLIDYGKDLEKLFYNRLKNEIGEMRHMLHLLASRTNSLSEPDFPENLPWSRPFESQSDPAEGWVRTAPLLVG